MLKHWKALVVLNTYTVFLGIGVGYFFMDRKWPVWIGLLVGGGCVYLFSQWGAHYWRNLLNRADKGLPQGLWLYAFHLRIFGVFFLAIIGAWAGHALGTYFFANDGAIARWMFTVPYLREMLDKSFPNRDHDVADLFMMLVYAIPPEKPGLLGWMHYVCWLIGGAVSWSYTHKFLIGDAERYRRGSKLSNFTEAKRTAKKHIRKKEPGIPWGGIMLPHSAANQHFMVAGTIGSGKTLTIRMLMQAVLPLIGMMPNRRAVILDPKQEYLPYLNGMDLHCPITIVNPFDIRCSAWDIARDCTTPAAAREIASIFIPLDGGQNRFFYDSSRHIITGIITVLIKLYGQKWTLLDLIRILRDKAAIKAMLEKTPETRDILNYCEHDDVFKDIHSTILTQIAPYETIVAAWGHAPRKFSLSEFVRSESILLLTLVEEIREPMNAIYHVLFKRLSEFLLSQSENTSRQTWLFVDEAKEAGELDGLGRLLTEGRSKGVCVVFGFQDVQGLQETYKEKLANELLGQCAHKAILRTHNAAAAEWLSQLIGEYETLEQTVSFPIQGAVNVRDPVRAKSGTKQNVNDSISKRQLILASEIMNLPPVNKKNGLVGYYLTPNVGCYMTKLRWKLLKDRILPPGRAKSFKPRPASHQYLPPFSNDDLTRLGIELSRHYSHPHDADKEGPSLQMITRKSLDS
jgi:hypothetical protein